MRDKKKWLKHIEKLFLMLTVAFCFIFFTQKVDAATSNYSVYPVQDKDGCNATNVCTYKTFYVNFWNSGDTSQQFKSTTATIKKNGTVVKTVTRTATNYMNWSNADFYLTEEGSYTLERSAVTTSGSTMTWDTTDMYVYHPSALGSVSVSSGSVSLSMTGTSSTNVTVTKGGILPDSIYFNYSIATGNVSCSWGEWDSTGQSCPLTITGKYGGSDTVTVTIYESSANIVVATATISVTVGPNYTVTYDAGGGSGAPSSQTKYYGKSLTLSNTIPTRSGYTFVGWDTGFTTGPSYSSGSSYTSNSSATLYAIWKKTNTLTYNANGGSGAPSSQNVTIYSSIQGGFSFGSSSNTTVSSTTPTKSGYTFLGWSTSSSATSASYTSGDTISVSSSMTLYAIWRKTVTLSYNANGGSGAPSSQTATVYNSTTSYSFTVSSTTPTRSGYSFLGWSTSSSATSASYSSGDTISVSSTTTLYAIWKKTVTLSYNANGGSGAPSSQSATVYNSTTSYSFTVSSTTPTRSGYSFLGWSTSSSATSASYSSGDTISVSSTTTLYAIWKKTVTLSYNANGGSGAPSSQSATVYNSTTSYSFTVSSTTPTRSGYSFLGWSTSSSATSASYTSGNQITLSSNTTLYAVWKEVITVTYTVTYNANGGSGAPASQTKTEGTTLKLSGTVPTRSGYTFMGWGTSSSATTVSYEPEASYSQDANITLYAIWQKPVTLTMHPNGGMIGNAYQSSTTMYLYNADTGKTFTVSTAVEPSREGYDFVGWNADSGAKTATYQKGDTITLSSDKTLYAIWRKGITLTYDGNGGSGAPSAVTGYLYNAETSYSFTISNTTPERSGYTFLGWSKDEGADNASYKVGDPVSLTSNTTLYAVWEAIPAATYTVTYDANGGTGAPASQTKTDGVDLTLSTVTPKRDGYTFAGWGTGSSSTAASYSAGSSYTKNANLTLYAIWKKTLTLAYNANGGSGAPASQSETIYNNVSEYTFTISNTKPSWEGHSFTGWGTSADAASTYGSGEDITVSENTTLYAIWSVIPVDEKVTLTYSNANGGENIPASRTVEKGSVVNLSGLNPTKEGYRFLGWSSNKDATSASYAPGDTVDLTSNLTLYAIWMKTITLSYHANGGNGQPKTVSETIYNTTTRATFSIDKQIPERDNYTFLGWNNDDNATSAAYAPGDAIDLSSNLTLYAVWKAKSEGGDTPGDDPTTEDPSGSETKPIVKKAQTITASNKTVAIKSSPFKLGAKTSGNGKLTYASSAKSVAAISATGVVTPRNYGETTITIKAAASSTYKASAKKIKIFVVPKKMVLKSAKAASNRGIQIKWNKDKTASGYEIQICLRKDFKSGAYQRFVKMSTVSKKITNLKKKTWYVRIRAYKKIGKKTYNGNWSNAKKVKVK